MLITAGAIVGKMSGRLGSHVASHNRGGPYFRLGTIPVQPNTPEQLTAKNALASASSAWGGLTDDQRNAWELWAQFNPIINRLGEPRILSGQQAYIQLNALLIQDAQTQLTLPPIASAPAPLDTLVGNYDIGMGTFDIVFTPTPTGANEKLLIRAAVVTNPGRNFVKNIFKLVDFNGPAAASPVATQAAIEARFGTLQVGERVFYDVRVWDTSTGLQSGPRVTNGTVVST